MGLPARRAAPRTADPGVRRMAKQHEDSRMHKLAVPDFFIGSFLTNMSTADSEFQFSFCSDRVGARAGLVQPIFRITATEKPEVIGADGSRTEISNDKSKRSGRISLWTKMDGQKVKAYRRLNADSFEIIFHDGLVLRAFGVTAETINA